MATKCLVGDCSPLGPFVFIGYRPTISVDILGGVYHKLAIVLAVREMKKREKTRKNIRVLV